MADNPTKHSELIEPGNPYEDAIKGLKEMIKLFDKLSKDLKKTGKQYLDFIKKQNVQTKQGKDNIKKMATAVDKLTAEEREALKIKKSLEREQAKLNSMNSTEYRQLLKTKEAQRQKNAELRKSIREMDKGTKSTNTWGKALGSFAAKFNTIGNVAANVIARIVQGLKEVSVESFRLAVRAEGIERAFNRLNKPGLLKELQKATRGTVSELDLMQRAVVASRFDIALEKLPVLLEFATKFAQDTGVAVDDLTDKIVRGIGRKSVLILDDLGLTATQIRKELNGMSVEAVSIATLTEAIGRIAKQSLIDLGTVVDTTAIQLESFKAEWSDFKREMGVVGIKVWDFLGSASFVGNMEALQMLNDELAKTPELRQFGQDMGDLFTTVESFDFVKTGLWGMMVAISEFPEKIEDADDLLDFLKKLRNEEMALVEEGGLEEWMSHLSDPDIDFAPSEQDFQDHLDRMRKASDEALDDDIVAQEDHEQMMRDLASDTFDLLADFTTTLADLTKSQKEKELSAVGDNAKKREAIEKKFAKKEQSIAIVSAIISTAQGVARAFGDYPFPYALIPAAIVSALGAVQIATIANATFAEGGSGLLGEEGGVLTGKSHQQGGVNLGAIGEAERGEYFGIVNKQMTKKYGGELPSIFDSLNNGAFHEVWNNNRSSGHDPYNKKLYEAFINTPTIIPDGKRMERYPDGRTRVVNG